jgi:hypothetical protein
MGAPIEGDRMRLVHYSDEPILTLLEIERGGGMRENFFKPHGFWLSVDDANLSWREWCIDNTFCLDRLTHVHDVTLARDANVLVITDPAGIHAVTEEFTNAAAVERWSRAYSLDWPKMRTRYDGLIITPYLWECRLEPSCMWYYAWDCASGVIWQRRAIAAVTLREVVPVPVPPTPIEEGRK